MKNLLYTAALGLLIVGCSKPTIEDEGFTITHEEQSNVVNSGTTTGTTEPATPTQAATQTTESDPSTTATPSITVPAGTTLIESFDDGKGNITHSIRVDDPTILAALVGGESQYFFFGETNSFQVLDGEDFEVFSFKYETINYRGIEILVEEEFTLDYNQIDDALDLAGENWVSNKIIIFDRLGDFGYAGIARGGEMIVSQTGFETHVLLHENGHNYDFAHENYSTLMDPLYHLVFDTGYYTGPIAEYRAEMFARYYLLVSQLPTQLVELMQSILG